ncbi:DUF4407 domain-containing protein [Chryseobacterium gambrini]|uniref:DUF4407 domain-containing protein n=1 Tax=Chryseobacterium gambrini TaxID=373672 RepID=UPI0022F3F2A5|nr:DUF4407 domain-containing protein [Chryseobacterium gambrini]WBX97525.1 DUF4407 domain-containing protein [Chryseobacterium gambrini]
MIKLLYMLGGYEEKIITAGNLNKINYLLPGISLFLIVLTSTWGGYHLSEITLKTNYVQYIFTFFFVIIILIVDFILLNSNKSGFSAFLRILLALSLGALVTVLTLLSIYDDEIKAKLTENVNTELKTKMDKYDNDVIEADSLKLFNDSQYIENNKLAGRELYQGNPEIGSPAGDGSEYKRYLVNAKQNLENSKFYKKQSDSLRFNRKSFETNQKQIIEEKQLRGLNGRILNLYTMANNDPITWFPIIVVFISLIVIDLVPISIKFGIKEKLDKDYENAKKTLKDDIRFYNPEKEKFFIKINDEKAIIEGEKERQIKKAERIKSNIQQLEEAKKQYANKKLQFLIDEINNWSRQKNTDSNSKTDNE